MTDLMALVPQMAPLLGAALHTLGGAVADAARSWVGEGVATLGQRFLESALRVGEGDTPTGGGTDEDAARVGRRLRSLLAELDPADRPALETALGHWLAEGAPGEPALRDHLMRQATLHQAHVVNRVSATGPGAMAIGQVVGDVHAGYRPDGGGR